MQQLEKLLKQFDPIGLGELNNAALLDRVDTKYALSIEQIYSVLTELKADYRVLEIKGRRLNRYQTLYFDTPDFDLYHQHHNAWGSRYKIRARKYVDSNLAFFEIKHKTNQDRTIKTRMPLDTLATALDDNLQDFVDETLTDYQAAGLEAKLWNEYFRATLVGKQRSERVTLDFQVSFAWGDQQRCLDSLVIVEVKQDQRSQESEFVQRMKAIGLRPLSFSKYCAGVYLLYHGVKMNNFKPKMRRIQKLMQELEHELH